MALSKAAGVIHTRTLLRKQGAETEARFLSQLTPEEKTLYQSALPVSKLPIETATKIYLLAVPLLYPDKPSSEGMQELARATAHNDMRGIYSVLIRMTTVEFIIKQTAKIWQTYHDAGRAETERLGPNQIVLRVKDYPGLPKPFLDIVTGYIRGALELAGLKRFDIRCRDANPAAWEWDVRWD